MRVQIELPGSRHGIIRGADGGTGMGDQVAGIRCLDGYVEKADGGCVPKTLAGQPFEHRSKKTESPLLHI